MQIFKIESHLAKLATVGINYFVVGINYFVVGTNKLYKNTNKLYKNTNKLYKNTSIFIQLISIFIQLISIFIQLISIFIQLISFVIVATGTQKVPPTLLCTIFAVDFACKYFARILVIRNTFSTLRAKLLHANCPWVIHNSN